MSGTGQGNGLALIVGANIRLARGQRKQRDLAAALDMSPQQLSDWERGAYRPNDANLFRVAEELGKDFAWFFTDHSDEQVAA